MEFYVGDTRATRVYLGDTLIYQDGWGKKLYKKNAGSTVFSDITSSVSWNAGQHIFQATVNNNIGDEVYITVDGEEPKPDYSNVGFYYVCTAVSGTFTIVNASPFTDGQNLSLVFLSL